MYLSEPVDLSNCDREPIHIPGSIQPHGVLMVLSEPDLTILQVSGNCTELLGRSPKMLLEKSLSCLLSPDRVQAIVDGMAGDFEQINPLALTISPGEESANDLVQGARSFDGILHRSNGLLILEIEPVDRQDRHDRANFIGFYHLVKGTLGKLQHTNTANDLCQTIVGEIRRLTGFDRVMVYKFDAQMAGQIVAEAKLETLDPYLYLHYPASDIPVQARHLYELNMLRSIPDADYQPVPLVPPIPIGQSAPTDLSLSVLRSVSPIHIEYMHNMGVTASMSISLLRERQLWGLIACHHRTPKYLSYEVRTACEFLGQVVALELKAKEENDELDYKMKLKAIGSQFVEFMPQAQSVIDGLLDRGTQLLELTAASGALVFWDDRVYPIGRVPDSAVWDDLLAWITERLDRNILATDELASLYPPAAAWSNIASGLLALAISRVNRAYILWFRPELIRTVNWGGNPHKPVEVSIDGEVRLSPRKSFALWQETVNGRSAAWQPCEIDAALDLRGAIVGIALRKADELAQLNIELERSNSELDSFAYIASHDLKEPLRGIHNYSTFLLEDYADTIDPDGIAKLRTLVRLTRRMEDLINSLLHFSRLGRVELDLQPTDLNGVVRSVLEVLRIGNTLTDVEIAIPRLLPSIKCDRVQTSEVFANLIGNAIKYQDRQPKYVEIGYLDPVTSDRSRGNDSELTSLITLYVKDRGIGILPHHVENIFRIFKRLHAQDKYGGGTGAGLTIAKKIVERHGGNIWLESTVGEGSCFYFTLPRATT
jgi:two-component system, chemotaxis family, sensor kinase Cph1